MPLPIVYLGTLHGNDTGKWVWNAKCQNAKCKTLSNIAIVNIPNATTYRLPWYLALSVN